MKQVKFLKDQHYLQIKSIKNVYLHIVGTDIPT